MESDLKRLKNPLETLVKGKTDNTLQETKVYFDNLHLSPLKVIFSIEKSIKIFFFFIKIHVSFSMHGSKASEQLLAEYPIVDFLLQILNVAEVQDVILKYFYSNLKD